MNENTAMLTEYGNELVAAGFEVWLTNTTWGGYLQYRDPATGCTGSLQGEYFGEWAHYMPIVPSRKYGSSMHMQDPLPPFTVEAARQCASPTNYNDAVGTRLTNAKDHTWRSADAIPLHAEFYGACGVPNCADCLPRFDLNNNEIPSPCAPCGWGEHADDGTGEPCPCCGADCPELPLVT